VHEAMGPGYGHQLIPPIGCALGLDAVDKLLSSAALHVGLLAVEDWLHEDEHIGAAFILTPELPLSGSGAENGAQPREPLPPVI
jgi:hypothetical protein